MTESGHGVQVLKLTDTHSYELDEEVLGQILLHEDIKDLPVVVVSVSGAYRGGKSFLLNFFLKYLTSPPPYRLDGSWLEDSEPLAGFTWRSGIKAVTMGISMWSEPLITTLPSGEKVAVLLMDTQGTFDSRSTVRDCSTIFALSTLLSSVQIYNLSQNIQEDDLQYLQLFAKYGTMVRKEGTTKAFQVLEILVRDWQYPYNYPYGAVGGEELLEDKFEITDDLPQELKDLRTEIRSSFEKVSCFLMPHPGFKVLKSSFKGNISDIDIEFRTHLKALVSSLFGPAKLMPKTVNGERIRAKDLFSYFKTYAALFNSGTLPSPMTIMQATVEAGLLSTFIKAREIYVKGMDSEAGPKQLSVPAVDLKNLHIKYSADAQAVFTSKKKMGSQEETDKYLEKLIKNLEELLPLYINSNVGKIQAAINEANESYEQVISNISKDQPLCVHPLDLAKIHKTGLDAAVEIFDKARKRVTDQKDDERTQFIQNFEKRYDLLRLSNQQNNKLAVDILAMEYWQYMQANAMEEPPLSAEEFQHDHEIALKHALEDFEFMRNLHNSYSEDVFKYNLTRIISDAFVQLKAIKKSTSRLAMITALNAYDSYMKTVVDLRKRQCLHPSDLERENERARCRALEMFRPQKRCSDGFDSDDEDENTLQDILRNRYREYKSLNDSANETAVREAFSVFMSTIDEKCRPSLWWIVYAAMGSLDPMISNLTKRNDYFVEAKNKATRAFYNRRRTGGCPEDIYKEKLDEMMTEYFSTKHNPPILQTIGKFVQKLPAILSSAESISSLVK